MKMTMVLLGVLAAGASTALHIERSLPDGLYTAEPDHSRPGQHVIRRHDGKAIEARGEQAGRHCAVFGCLGSGIDHRWDKYKVLREELPLPPGQTFCKGLSNYTTDDYHQAINALFESPLYWIPPKSARFALYGNSVAYICTYDGWNSGSLIEYMAAIGTLDEKCGELKAGKLGLKDWAKLYGRDGRGSVVCEWEDGFWSIDTSELPGVPDRCPTYVNGLRHWLGMKGECNENGAGKAMWKTMKQAFPWYKTKEAA